MSQIVVLRAVGVYTCDSHDRTSCLPFLVQDGILPSSLLVKGNSSLNRALIPHRLQTLLPLLELEGLVHDTVDLDFATIEVVDRGGEFVGLGEGAEDGDFVAD